MEKENFKKAILQRKFSIITIVVLLVIIVVLFGQKQDYKYTLLDQYQTIPSIELGNTLLQTQNGLLGEVRGFIKFDNLEAQPKSARQYYIIKSLDRFDENQSQYFSLEEIIKMQYLSPKSLGVSLLVEAGKNSRTITLVDENGNQFFIDKSTKTVSMIDTTGDNITLITSDSDYKDFIKRWILKK